MVLKFPLNHSYHLNLVTRLQLQLINLHSTLWSSHSLLITVNTSSLTCVYFITLSVKYCIAFVCRLLVIKHPWHVKALPIHCLKNMDFGDNRSAEQWAIGPTKSASYWCMESYHLFCACCTYCWKENRTLNTREKTVWVTGHPQMCSMQTNSDEHCLMLKLYQVNVKIAPGREQQQ